MECTVIDHGCDEDNQLNQTTLLENIWKLS